MQLLRIKQVPISIEMETVKASANMTTPRPVMRIDRERNGLNIESVPTEMVIDNEAFHNSIGLPSNSYMTDELISYSRQAALSAIANLAQEGNYMSDSMAGNGATIADIIYQRLNTSIESTMAFIPSDRPEISWSPGRTDIRYVADKINISWDLKRPQFDFVPGRIKFTVKQWHKVEIEYIGKPSYVPPSADPEPNLGTAI